MKAPIGASIGLYMDTPRVIERGHFIETRTGRIYLVLTVRRQAKGTHAGRWHLRCLVVKCLPVNTARRSSTVVHSLRWYKRGHTRR